MLDFCFKSACADQFTRFDTLKKNLINYNKEFKGCGYSSVYTQNMYCPGLKIKTKQKGQIEDILGT